MKFDLEDMTIGELVVFEDLTGKSVTEMATPSAKDLQALALIVLRRSNPDATLEDASAVKMSSFTVGDDSPN